MAIRWNEAALQRLASSPAGPVGAFLTRKGKLIESRARVLTRQEGLVRSSHYFNSHKALPVTFGGSLILQVTNDAPYAKYLEEGTDPHLITAHGEDKYLAWERKVNHREGWVEFVLPQWEVKQVNHPGNRAYRILHRAVEDVMGKSVTARIALGG